MTDVRMPDGTIVKNVPDGITQAQLLEKFNKLKSPEPEKSNFFERFGDDLKFRFGEQGAATIDRVVSGEQDLANTLIQLAGNQGAGTVMDFLGEVVISGGRGLKAITVAGLSRGILPTDFVEGQIDEAATKAGMAFLNTKLGQMGLEAATKGALAWQEFAEEHPVAASSIGAVVNIGLLVAPVKAKPLPTEVNTLTKAGQRLEKSAARSVKQNKKNLAEDLATPAQTKKARVEQTGRTTEKGGLLNQKVVELSPEQKLSAIEIEKLPVSRKNTLQGNLNVIKEATDAEAKSLKKKLASLPDAVLTKEGVQLKGRYTSKELADELDAAFIRIQNTGAGLVGDPEKSVIKAMERMKALAAEEKPTLSGLLQARKNFDFEITRQRKNFFETDTSNALQLAVREVRQTTNNFIAARAPNKGVRQSLNKQHRLHNAMDTLSVRAASEGNNRIIRGFRNALKLLPFRGEFNQFMAAIFGIGGLGASAKFAPFFTKIVGVTGVTYVAGKAVTRPGARKGLAGLLTMIDRAMQRTTDPAVLRQFRTDRAAIVELLKASEEKIKEDK
jgi:hypothetical protein